LTAPPARGLAGKIVRQFVDAIIEQAISDLALHRNREREEWQGQ
jgi:hypothetical protein